MDQQQDKVSRRVKWGVIGLLAVCAVLAIMLTWSGRSSDSALWFVGLLVLMATALTLTAIVFGGLDLNDANEAFGLPSGSVRTLLAVGVMVLFAVFGLKFFGDAQLQASTPRLSDKPLEQIEVPVARLEVELARYQQVPSLMVVIASPGRAPAGNDPGANAKLNLYTLEPRPSAAAVDAQKQLLTAIITLLTTVIGFYFGSKSASEGLRNRSDASPPNDPAAPQRQQAALVTGREALEAQIQADRDTLDALREASRLTAPRTAKFGEALDAATALDRRIEQLRDHLARALTEAQARLSAIAAAPAGGEAAAREAAQKALARAHTEFDALKLLAQEFATAVVQLREMSAGP